MYEYLTLVGCDLAKEEQLIGDGVCSAVASAPPGYMGRLRQMKRIVVPVSSCQFITSVRSSETTVMYSTS